jgi:hypothetical protein
VIDRRIVFSLIDNLKYSLTKSDCINLYSVQGILCGRVVRISMFHDKHVVVFTDLSTNEVVSKQLC